MKRLGKMISEARMKKNLTLRELSRRIGSSTMYISEIENEKKIPGQNSKILDSIANELSLDPLELYEAAAFTRVVRGSASKMHTGNSQLRLSVAKSIFEVDESKLKDVWRLLNNKNE